MEHLFTCSNCQHLNDRQCRLHSLRVNAGNEVCPQHAITTQERAAVQYHFCKDCAFFDPAGEQLCRSADQPATQAFPVNCHRYRSLLAGLPGHVRLNETADEDKSGSVSIVSGDDEPEPLPQKPPRRSASQRFPFLRYVNPFTLICLLLLLAAVGVFFQIAPWHSAPQETLLVLLLTLPCMGLLWGLIWGVMNRPVKLLHALTSLVLSADAARLVWEDGTPDHLAVCAACAVVVLLLSYGLSLLGTVITNSIFRVRRRAA